MAVRDRLSPVVLALLEVHDPTSALADLHFVGPTLSIRGQRSFCVDLGSQGPQGRSIKT